MRNLKIVTSIGGIFYPTKRLLKFRNQNEMVSEEDLMNLFAGFVRLIKKTTEIEIEERYLNKIAKLEKELKYLKSSN